MYWFWLGTIAAMPVWITVGWLMRRDNYVRYDVPASAVAAPVVPALAERVPPLAPVNVHVHLPALYPGWPPPRVVDPQVVGELPALGGGR